MKSNINRFFLLTLIALVVVRPIRSMTDALQRYPKTALVLGIASAWCGYVAMSQAEEIRWDWNDLAEQVEAVQGKDFPRDFQWGAATSAYQTEGAQGPNGSTITSSWTELEKNGSPKGFKPVPAGSATDHWARYKEDIKLLKDMGLNTFRLSVKWEAVEPELGKFDQAAIDHYVDVVKACKEQGVEPVITLFHHTWPVWFDKLGGFEKRQNVKHFVEFGNKVFDALHAAGAKCWMPLNEPAGYAMAGFVDGRYPPCKRLDFKGCGRWLRNILDAHTQLYRSYKAQDKTVSVGIATVVMPMDPLDRYNPFDVLVCKLVDRLLNEVTLQYLTTGVYDWNPPFRRVKGFNAQARGALDFIGINYYSHKHMHWFKEAKPADQILDKEIYPEGLYRAIKYCDQFAKKDCFKNRPDAHIPLMITENGISLPDVADARRTEYMKKHLYVVKKALEEGYDIRGYHWWTLTDNYNWANGFDSNYGLYKIDFKDPAKTRTFKPSAQALADVAQQWERHHRR